MDNNDTITLTRRQFETLSKLICGGLLGHSYSEHAAARLPFSPATCARFACEAAPNDLGTQKTLQDFLIGASR